MKKLFQRILLFIIGIPTLYAIIFLLPQANHLVFNLAAVLFSFLAGRETERLFKSRGIQVILGTAVLSTLLPIVAYLEIIKFLPPQSVIISFVLLACIFLAHEAFVSSTNKIPEGIYTISASLFTVFYSGLLMSYIVMLTSFKNPAIVIACFILIVFANDTAAYIFGMLFGKKTRGIIPVSPNKSLVGFLAGFCFSIIVSIIFWRFFPQVFDNNFPIALAAGITLGFTTIFGDLSESALKRSAGVKDSGTLMLGRGGVLDSIDSLLFSAPFFYYILLFANQ